jgi:BNR repeat protein
MPAPPTPPPGDPALPDPQFRASNLSPFTTGCEGTPATGTVYTNSEVEPWLAVNPRDFNNLVGVWQQDRWSNGGAKGLVTGVSFDGGRTWAQRMAAFTRCTGGNSGNGGDYERASDPWVSISPDGTAYQSALSFNGQALAPGSSSAILVSRSADGGRTWNAPVTLIRDGSSFFNDKESITADPTDARYVFAVWDRLSSAGDAPAYIARTTNGGVTWEPARPIYDPGRTSQTLNNQIVVLPDGALVLFCTQLDTDSANRVTASLVVIRSADKGVTWSAPVVVSPMQALGTRDPDVGTPIRDGANLGAIAVGPGGALAVVWQDARFSAAQRDGIAFSRSSDGGLTWSTAARINRDPSVQAFEPSVAIRNDGTYGVAYFDMRSNTSDPADLPTDYWIARSTDGIIWHENRVAGPFNLADAPNAGGLFVGDYQGLVSVGSVFVPFYAAVNNGDFANRTDVFASLASAVGVATKAAAAEKETADSPMQVETVEPLPVTPDLRQRLHDSVMRTMRRRLPDWTPPGSASSRVP